MRQENNESSVMVSLRELVALESERVEEEEELRQQARIAAEHAREQEQQRRLAAELARRTAEQARREQQAQRDAEQAARLQAIELAELERARLEADAEAKQRLVEAQQHHQQELARIQQDHGSSRLKTVGALGTFIVLFISIAAAVGWSRHSDKQRLADTAASARLNAERQRMTEQRFEDLNQLRDQLSSELLRLEQVPAAVSTANAQVQQAHARAAAGALRDADLDAYAQALATFAATLPRAHRLARLTQLDALHQRLKQHRAELRRKPKALELAAERSTTARANINSQDPTEVSLRAFRNALDRMTHALPAAVKKSLPNKRPQTSSPVVKPSFVCDKGDPLCGLKGKI